MGVARASLEELFQHYQCFLRQNGLGLWDTNSPEALAARHLHKTLCDASDRSDASDWPDPCGISTASPEVAANTVICLIHQASYLPGRPRNALEQQFLTEGGFTERLYRARKNSRRP